MVTFGFGGLARYFGKLVRIAKENSDFKDYIDKVDGFYKRNKGIDKRVWASNIK